MLYILQAVGVYEMISSITTHLSILFNHARLVHTGAVTLYSSGLS